MQIIAGSNNPAIRTLIKLHFDHIFPECRATLYTNSPYPRVRTALWIELGDVTDIPYPFFGFKGLWLIELENYKVILHGSQQHHTDNAVGGRVIHDVEVLDINSQWLSELAECLALDLCGKADDFYCWPLEGAKVSLLAMELGLLKNAVRSFTQELDNKTIAILAAERTGRISIYNYYASANPERQRNRVQAAESFPWFSRTFRNDWRLRQAIDNGKPLVAELATCYQAQPCTIKYFQGFDLLQVPAESRTRLIKNLDHYTADYFPSTLEDHEAFITVADTLDDLASTLQVAHIQLARPFVNGWKSGIQRLEESLGRALNLGLIFDMAQASFYYGVKPALEKTGAASDQSIHPSAKWFQLWFGQYGLKRLLEMAYTWEHIYAHFSLKRLGMHDRNKVDKILNWPQLLPSTYCHGPYRVVELASQHALETEGRNLKHCVASYGISCLVAGSFIYSIRDRLGNRLSTFEIKFEDGAPALQQHKALHNEEPEVEEQAIVERFIKGVLSTVSMSRVNKINCLRNGISLQMKGIFDETDSFEAELNDEEKKHLGSMVEFTHPPEVVRMDIVKYLKLAGIA